MSQLDSHLDRVERYGFIRRGFPLQYHEHEIHLLKNDVHETVDNRLQVHIILHCPRCDEDSVVRSRLPPESREIPQIARVAKMLALGKFRETCSVGPNHTYYGP